MKLKKLKHWVIAHEENGFIPHILRDGAIAILFLSLAFLLGYVYAVKYFFQKTVLGASVSTAIMIDLTNSTRMSNGENVLLRNQKLDKAAELKSDDMINVSYFAHKSPDGKEAWDFMHEVGYDYKYAGENLAVHYMNENEAHTAWMNSPTHRSNILDKRFTEIGMFALNGVYKGVETLFIVQMFGRPKDNFIPTSVAVGDSNVSVSSDQMPKVLTNEKIKLAGNTNIENKVLEEKKVVVEKTEILPTPLLEENKVAKATATENVTLDNGLVVNGRVLGVEESVLTINDAPKYSSSFSKFLYFSPDYIRYIFIFILVLVGSALGSMLFIEFKNHHYKHMAYAGGLAAFIITALLL